jgi:hypothetical protein
MTSQRDKNFKGGIQKGTVATDTVAKKLDVQCKTIKESIFVEGLRVQRKIRQDQIPGGIGACEPDGGAWFKDSKLVAVFEGKKQGMRGNAIERWFKNNFVCRRINPDVCYVTFCVGEGAGDGEVLRKTLNIAHLEGTNQFNPNNNSVYYSEDGFSEKFIRNVMQKVLEYCAEKN